jgi:hypothetical protein
VHWLDNKYIVSHVECLSGHQLGPKAVDDMTIQQTVSSGMLTLLQQTYNGKNTTCNKAIYPATTVAFYQFPEFASLESVFV